MAISRNELIKKINNWRKDKSINLSDDYLDYLDSYITPKNISVFAVDDSGKELDDYTPEFEAAQAEVLDDLGLSDKEIDEIMGNTDNDESLVIGGTDIFKEPFTEEQLAILRGDDNWNKLSEDEFNALRAGDRAKAKTARDAQLKRARELLEGNDESLVIGGTDIFKEPFTEEQLAILRGDDSFNKLSEDEFNALRAADRAKAKTARDAKLKRARELLEGNDESLDKPHDKELAGDTTPEEDFMQRAAEGKIPATSGVLAGDLTPEEIEMIQMMRANKKKSDDATTLSDERFKRIVKNLSSHRF